MFNRELIESLREEIKELKEGNKLLVKQNDFLVDRVNSNNPTKDNLLGKIPADARFK